MDELKRIRGSEKIVKIFGFWPTFHDAEIVSVRLDRAGADPGAGPVLRVDLHTFTVNRRPPDAGRFTFENHSVVTLKFENVFGLKLDGFNAQNAIFGLHIAGEVHPEPPPAQGFRVTFDPAYGMASSFWCEAIEVEAVTPGIPPHSVYLNER